MRGEFVLCDVFAERPLTGNQLAVLFGADDLDDAARLALAREFGWSEITFVAPPARTGDPPGVGIWTPTGELPFAGHPVIGTTVVAALRGLLPRSGNGALGLRDGPLPVEVLSLAPDGSGGTARLTARPPQLGATVTDRAALARALGLESDDLVPDLTPQTSSVGLPFLIVPLRSLAAIQRLRLDPARLPDLLGTSGARRPYVFTLETLDPGAAIHARMFDIDREDPATGSAAGALGAYLAHHRVVPADRIEIEQGHFMNRPSRLTVEVTQPADGPPVVQISGQVFVWGEGRLR